MRSSRYSLRWLVAIATLAVCAAASANTTGIATSSERIDAIWHVQSFPFEYRSNETYYNCDALAQKVRAILLAVGAHPSVIVDVHCQHGMANYIVARIAVATAVPASAENIRAATTFNTRDELIARLNRVTLPTSTDIPHFVATWQTLPLARTAGVNLTLGDCDLLRGMNEQVFPRLFVRVTQSRFLCNNNHASHIRPNIRVQALIPETTSLNPLALN